MKRNTTLNLPADLIDRTRAYALMHGTTMTKLIEDYLSRITAPPETVASSVLLQYSEGKLSVRDACRLGGYRDSAELLLALAEVRLPFPRPPRHIIEQQAEDFAKVMKRLRCHGGESGVDRD